MEQSEEGLRVAASTREALKRKREEQDDVNGLSAQPAAAVSSTLSHEFVAPEGYSQPIDLDPNVHGTTQDPVYHGKRAKEYYFKLDKFQEISIACLVSPTHMDTLSMVEERKESVLVSAHTSAGKTAVAEYAIAMGLRDNQRVVYTSPLKALSNQKFRELEEEFHDVGLMTGDVSVNPNAQIMVMTTEILRSMLYRGSELEREVAWVIFDEVHYMQDRERGVVWEETIIFLPKETRMVFLSATLSNSTQFAAWISHLRQQPCHVVYTDFRPTPLQHYAFPQGGNGLFLIKDENMTFRADNFSQMQTAFGANARQEEQAAADERGRGAGRGRSRGRGRGRGRGQGAAKQDQGDVAADITKILKMVKMRKLEPVIIFSFARRECELYASHIQGAQLDFTTEEEKEQVQTVFDNAMQCLNETDRELEAIVHIAPLLKAGIGVHHSGLLPIVKELTELLFQEHLIKVLFATETFAMGLNMPARTVLFTNLHKWDGEEHRVIASGEYIQMSGRAGRRGKDDRGLCILMADDRLTVEQCREMVMGKPSPLISSFKLSYYTLLNLLRRLEGSGQDIEYVIKRSFQQFQFESNLPQVRQELEAIEKESATTKALPQGALMEYLKLRADMALKSLSTQDIQDKEKLVLREVLRPEACMQFMRPGRLLHVRDGPVDWAWGVLVRPRREAREDQSLRTGVENVTYVMDVLLICSLKSSETKIPIPPEAGEDGEMHVVPVPLSLVHGLSTLRISLPEDLRPPENRKATMLTVKVLQAQNGQDCMVNVSFKQELHKRYPDGLPRLDPVEDMGIRSVELSDAMADIKSMEDALQHNTIHQAEKDGDGKKLPLIQRKAWLQDRAEELRSLMQDSQLHSFRAESRNRTAVLRRLGHVDDKGLVLTKGRAACEIDAADELLTVELMFNGVFSKLDKHQVVALASCLIPLGEKTQEEVRMKRVLADPLSQLQETARHISDVSNECKLPMAQDEYVESFRPTLMDVVHAWSKGSSFATICEMTDIFEGSIVRFMRRLDELIGQLIKAASVVGEVDLASKFEESVATIRRDIIFSASLYI